MINNIDFALLCYNEHRTIPLLVDHIVSITKDLNITDYRIIIIDDGSDNRTKELLKSLCVKYPGLIEVVTHPVRMGYGAAHRSALLSSRKDWILYTDGDGQYPIYNFKKFIDVYDSNIKFYTGRRINRQDSYIRRFITKIYNYLISIIFGVHLYDFGCAFRLIGKDILRYTIPQSDSGFSSAEQIIRCVKYKIELIEVEIEHKNRIYDKSRTFNILHIIKIIRDIIKVKWGLTRKK